MSIPNLPVNFKDDILAASNPKRKYQQTFNSDGSVSLEDVTVYTQQGSDFGASQVNQTNGAINNIYNERIIDLDELELVTEPGFFVDALAVKELNDKLPVVLYDNDDTPAKGAITLSESSANFTRLKIFYKNTNGFYGSVDVYNPNGKTVTLLNFAYGDVDNTDPMILKFRVIDISDNKIDTSQSSSGTYVTGEQRLSEGRHYTKGNFIVITQVLGYRG